LPNFIAALELRVCAVIGSVTWAAPTFREKRNNIKIDRNNN